MVLLLSGGGFRAALFHLGVIKALRDSSLLTTVVDVCGVSGGSIVAAHLVAKWALYTGSDEDFRNAAGEIVALARSDVRNRIIRRLILRWPTKFICVGRRLASLRPSATTMLIAAYRRLFGPVRLGDAALASDRPRFHLLATNLTTGELCSFSQGTLTKHGRNSAREISATTVELALAVGASSAFPAFFPPVPITKDDLELRRNDEFLPATQFLTDGGVFDNLGLRKLHLLAHGKRIDAVVASDAGGCFDLDPRKYGGILSTAVRSTDILMRRVAELESSLLDERARTTAVARQVQSQHDVQRGGAPRHAGERSTYGNIGEVDDTSVIFARIEDAVTPDEDRAALPAAVQAPLKSIRTDLDAFSIVEVQALIRHGYCVARKQLQRAYGSAVADANWNPFPLDSDRKRGVDQTKRLLRAASHRHFRLLSFTDWVSYVFLIVLLVAFGSVGVAGYRVFYEVDKAFFITNAFEANSRIAFAYRKELHDDMARRIPELSTEILDKYRAVAGKVGSGDVFISASSLRGISYYTFPSDVIKTIMDIEIRKTETGVDVTFKQRPNELHSGSEFTVNFIGQNGEYKGPLIHPKLGSIMLANVTLSGLSLPP